MGRVGTQARGHDRAAGVGEGIVVRARIAHPRNLEQEFGAEKRSGSIAGRAGAPKGPGLTDTTPRVAFPQLRPWTGVRGSNAMRAHSLLLGVALVAAIGLAAAGLTPTHQQRGLAAEDGKAATIPSAGETSLQNGNGDNAPDGEKTGGHGRGAGMRCCPAWPPIRANHRPVGRAAAGPCKPDIAAFCKDVGLGDGRVVACLTDRILASKKGNAAGAR